MKQCDICSETDSSKFYIANNNKCKSCLSKENKEKYKNLSKEEKEKLIKSQYEWQKKNIIKYLVTAAKGRALKRGLDFDLTEESVLKILCKQKSKCYYTEENMTYNRDNKTTVSIDRVDSNKGYTIDNIVLCQVVINRMKQALTTKEFLELCKLVVDKTPV